uniref:Uncharacterized protein n=1 Tax=Oryza sativa subsp. japonica TaxID=39947 RepID=Q75H23_ORYSJ|nr:hypothetical protein [Oryza sativa Japonica Group]
MSPSRLALAINTADSAIPGRIVGARQQRKLVQACSCQERHSAVFDLARCGFKEEGYPVVDYESALQTAKSTTVR